MPEVCKPSVELEQRCVKQQVAGSDLRLELPEAFVFFLAIMPTLRAASWQVVMIFLQEGKGLSAPLFDLMRGKRLRISLMAA
jgi:hypothetical protein